MEKRCMGLVLLLLLLLVVWRIEGRMCESQSHKFHGLCMSDRTCVVVCKEEDFDDGKCRGFRHRCFCRKPC
ncbi:hypothetical protein ACJRO7_025240 [Eucalyptus globulus]|uniref:Knottins-like domain-containing protein n=1 Tax=Eucalyptus globulus TaxID=34317 RepID=A0ABD3K893_EUCGL